MAFKGPAAMKDNMKANKRVQVFFTGLLLSPREQAVNEAQYAHGIYAHACGSP